MKYNGQILPKNWAPVGPTMFVNSGYEGSKGFPWLCVLNNRLTVLFVCDDNFNGARGFIAFSVDDSGAMCTYQSQDFVPGSSITYYVRNITQSGNSFLCVSGVGTVTQFTLPTTFSPGGTLIVPNGSFVPVNPCGGGDLARVIFIESTGLVAATFIQAFPDANNWWVTFYSGGDLINPLYWGFLGNYPSTFDPFYRFAQSNLPQYPGTPYSKNGALAFSPGGSVGYEFQNVGATSMSLVGSPGSLVCGGSGNSGLYVTASAQFYEYLADMGASYMSSGDIYNACSDVPGTYAVSNFSNTGGHPLNSLYNAYVYLEVKGPQYLDWNLTSGFGAVFARAKVYQLQDVSVSGLNNTYQLHSADFDFEPFAPPPVITYSQFDNLGNFHRPVSPQGKYYA